MSEKTNSSKGGRRISEEEIENYARQFIKATRSVLESYGAPIYTNPFIQNQLLKGISASPVKYSREDIEKMISDPRHFEDEIRALSEYIYFKVTNMKRLVKYFANILEFDWYLEPINADIKDMESSSFKRSYKKSLDYVEKIDPKFSFTKIMNMVMTHDVYYAYMRENDDYIVYQQMPADFCMITYENELGYGYSFDCSYFLQPGVNFDDYDPVFREYFELYKTSEEYKYGVPFWIRLKNDVAPVFKFDDNRAVATPPFMGSYIDSIELDYYKEAYKKNAEIQMTKLILNKIPILKEGGTQKKDNFAVDAVTAGIFNRIIQESLPQMVKSITSPLEADVVDFNEDGVSRSNVVSDAFNSFYSGVGTPSIFFGENSTSKSGIRASQKTDEMFVSHMYRRFERHVNYHLNRISGKYKFKIHFEGTVWDRDERFERSYKMVSIGAPLTYLSVSSGKSPSELENMLNLERALGYKKNLELVASMHTSSSKSGRPMSDESNLTDDGEKSRDSEVNDNY